MMIFSAPRIHAEIVDLTSDEFYAMATMTGQVDLMIYVRTQVEWDAGHIENATFMDSLHTILRTTPNAAMNILKMSLSWTVSKRS